MSHRLRSGSPKGRISRPPTPISSAAQPKRTCMCSPTTHPGSFRCSLHRQSSTRFSSKLHAGRSSILNLFVRSGSIEGQWARRVLTALIRPSSHQMRRRMSFQPQPSRLRYMTRAE
ncbi:hypothetical protein SUGI_0506180 [Cryptomeria japonica]|nr:hypothetical protein SUGI_0506180 [Cryptomeria japonica]